jgi:hypothetical protein
MRHPLCLPQILTICLCLFSLIPRTSGRVANSWQPVPKEDLDVPSQRKWDSLRPEVKLHV